MSLEFGDFNYTSQLVQRQRLFNDAFPEHRGLSVASVEHYKWKFHSSAFYPRSYEYEATEGGEMVGYYAAIPYPYSIDGRPVLAGMVCDVMTDSKVRGRGVFTGLGGFALNQLEATNLGFVTGYPVRPEVMGGHLRVGWEVVFELPMYLKPLRANAILRSKGLDWLAPMANIGIAIYDAVVVKKRSIEGYTSISGSPTDLVESPRFAEFLKNWSASVPNHLVKSAAFYKWRLGAPGSRYQIFLVLRDDRIIAAAIGRQAPLHGIPSLALLDVMVLNGHEQSLQVLYRDIHREAQIAGSEAVVTMMSRHAASKYGLIRHGFVKSPFIFRLILRSVSSDITVQQISRQEDWHLMWIDSDDL